MTYENGLIKYIADMPEKEAKAKLADIVLAYTDRNKAGVESDSFIKEIKSLLQQHAMHKMSSMQKDKD